eukprot:5631504-Amphidinium_carterae.1
MKLPPEIENLQERIRRQSCLLCFWVQQRNFLPDWRALRRAALLETKNEPSPVKTWLRVCLSALTPCWRTGVRQPATSSKADHARSTAALPGLRSLSKGSTSLGKPGDGGKSFSGKASTACTLTWVAFLDSRRRVCLGRFATLPALLATVGIVALPLPLLLPWAAATDAKVFAHSSSCTASLRTSPPSLHHFEEGDLFLHVEAAAAKCMDALSCKDNTSLKEASDAAAPSFPTAAAADNRSKTARWEHNVASVNGSGA